MHVQTPGFDVAGGKPEDVNGTAELLDQVIVRVPGLMEKDELELLHGLAVESPGTIVELGAAWGRSTAALCLGAQSGGVDVVTVDAFVWQGVSWLPQGLDAPTAETLRDNLAALSLAPRIIEGQTWQAAGQVDGQVGLLFHDADHSGEAVERDLAAWVPKLRPDAIIVFHDYYHQDCPEVKPVADEWAERHGWHKGERARYLQVFRQAAAKQNGVAAQRTLADADTVATAQTLPSTAIPEVETVVQEYLRAFTANDLDASQGHFADDAVLDFMIKRFVGREQIKQWHKQRFGARLAITSIVSTETMGDTVAVEAIVTSNRLRRWKVRMQIRATFCVAESKIRTLILRPVRWVA